MHTALPYFPQAPPSSVAIATDYKCSYQHCLASGDDIIERSLSYSQDSLLMSAAQVALCYVTVRHRTSSVVLFTKLEDRLVIAL